MKNQNMKEFLGVIMILCSMMVSSQTADYTFEELLISHAKVLRSVVYNTNIEKLFADKSIKEIKTQILNLALSDYIRILDTLPNSKFKYEILLGKADILFDLGNAAEGKKIYAELYKATDKDWNFGRLDYFN